MKQSTTSGLLVNISFLGFILAMLVYAAYNLIGSGGAKKAAGYAGSALMSICMVLLTIRANSSFHNRKTMLPKDKKIRNPTEAVKAGNRSRSDR